MCGLCLAGLIVGLLMLLLASPAALAQDQLQDYQVTGVNCGNKRQRIAVRRGNNGAGTAKRSLLRYPGWEETKGPIAEVPLGFDL